MGEVGLRNGTRHQELEASAHQPWQVCQSGCGSKYGDGAQSGLPPWSPGTPRTLCWFCDVCKSSSSLHPGPLDAALPDHVAYGSPPWCPTHPHPRSDHTPAWLHLHLLRTGSLLTPPQWEGSPVAPQADPGTTTPEPCRTSGMPQAKGSFP